MKAITCLLFLLATGGLLRADEIRFQLNHFGGINIETNKGKEKVRVYQENKRSEETILESSLVPVGSSVFVTPGGTHFALEHLDQPIVNDENRHLDSGDWRLKVSGKGKEFERLKARMPFVAFGELPSLVYLGAKTK